MKLRWRAAASNARRAVNGGNSAGRSSVKIIEDSQYRKAINVGIGLASKSVWGLRTALDIVYYNPQRSKDENSALMKKAWTDGLNNIMVARDPMSAYDDLVKNWQNAAGNKIKQEYNDAIAAAS